MSNGTARKQRKVKIERGSGNVFADLELSDADEMLTKANLVHEICSLIEDAGLTQAQAATRLGIDQPKVSMLMRGRLKDFSIERLMRFLVRLGRDVVISVEKPGARRNPGFRTLLSA